MKQQFEIPEDGLPKMPGDRNNPFYPADPMERLQLTLMHSNPAQGGGEILRLRPDERPRPGVIKRAKPVNELQIPAPRSSDINWNSPLYIESPDSTFMSSRSTWKEKYNPTEHNLKKRGIAYEGDPPKFDSNRSEETFAAERIILEGIDTDGTMRAEGSQFRWLGKGVIAYPGTKADDRRGVDVVLVFTDENLVDANGLLQGYGLAVDITTDRDEFANKSFKDTKTLAGGNLKLDSATWADWRTDKNKLRIGNPKEGKIDVNHISIYLPGEWIKFFSDVQNIPGPNQINTRMAELRSFVAFQIQAQLEFQACMYLEIMGVTNRTPLRNIQRSDLEVQLERAMNSKDEKKSSDAKRLHMMLTKIWKSTDTLPPLHKDVFEELPKEIKEFGLLQKTQARA